MKLLQKTNRTYALFSALLLLLAGVLLYFLMTNIMTEEVNEKLQVEVERVVAQLENGQSPPHLPPVLEVEELAEAVPEKGFIKDTVLYDPIEEDEEPFREVTQFTTIGQKRYRITARRVVLEPHDYLQSIGPSLLVVFLLLLTGLYFINRRIAQSLWKPFYENLERLKAFSLQTPTAFELQPSNIQEFTILNEVLLQLTKKLQQDFQSLKEFTENASHEIQTPLAIIQSKLELLLQSDALTAKELEPIQAAYDAGQKLMKINKGLLLLAKIDNRQYGSTEALNIADALARTVKTFEELIQAKQLQLTQQVEPNCEVQADPILLDMLLSNLIGNAIKHNVHQGNIDIQLTATTLKVTNSGLALAIAPEELLKRFKKGNAGSSSVGLGLSICQKICDQYGWQFEYTTEKAQHILAVGF